MKYMKALSVFILVFATHVCAGPCTPGSDPAETRGGELSALRVEGRFLVDGNGKKVRLVGVEVPWVFIQKKKTEEAYRDFLTNLGPAAAEYLDKGFAAWFSESDVKRIKDMGANCIRLTVAHWTFEERSYHYSETSFREIAEVIGECGRQGIYVVVSCVTSPGGQNAHPHSGAGGQNRFWEDPECLKRYASMWKEIAERFKGYDAVAGYDVLNEPLPPSAEALETVYAEIVKSIRSTGDHHVVFLQTPTKPDIEMPVLSGENIAYSFHFYAPTAFTHQRVEGARYPGEIQGQKWDINTLEDVVKERFLSRALQKKLCVWVGEFGTVDSAPEESRLAWTGDCIKLWDKYDLGWSYFIYKVGRQGRSFAIFKANSDLRRSLAAAAPRGGKINEKSFDDLKTENFVQDTALTGLLERAMEQGK